MIRKTIRTGTQRFGGAITGGTYLALTVALVAATPDRPDTSPQPTVEPAQTVLVAPVRDVAVSITEYKIEMPASVEAGEVTFVIRNGGTEEHSFKIARDGWDASLENQLGPGDTENLTVTLEAGMYEITCPLSEDVEKVTLEVTAGS